MRNRQLSSRLLMGLALTGAAVVSLAGYVFWDASKAVRDWQVRVAAESLIPFVTRPAAGSNSAGFEWINAPSSHTDSASFAGRIYLAGPTVIVRLGLDGKPEAMSLVESIAGAESVLALYDVGKIEFLYITKLSSARRLQNILWRTRANFEPRNVADSPYYVRVESKSGRIIAFAATEDYLLLATSEDPLAGTLKLLAGESGVPVTGQPWYADGVQAAGRPGELRMVLDMGSIVRSSHFRSYWIQQNVSELRQYRAAVSDLHRRAGEIRERRVFLRPAATDGAEPRPEQSNLVAELTRLVPDDSGLYRVWSAPKLQDTLTLLKRKILARHTGRPPAPKVAPAVVLSGGRVGTEAALETRIDEPPPAPLQGGFSREPLRVILERAGLKAVLHAQSSRRLSDSVFFGDESLVVLLADSDWNLEQARDALAGSVRGLWTASRLGAQWTDRNQNGETCSELNGLTPLLAAARGKHLFVANATEPLLAALRRMTAQVAGPRFRVCRGVSARPRERQLPPLHGAVGQWACPLG